ncbi:alpha/beta fold hydrolase [Nocardia salmonicida]|uniref:alpha/beta fold hydrolase n=1 Tax=Nocardia salmonicida TaxID=53431 RepID=UPI000A782AB5|nr:alpha/beta fold hydrolase [Nocardia salmonicida]
MRKQLDRVAYTTRTADGSQPPVPMRVYDALPQAERAPGGVDDTAVLWIHGGGFAGGSLRMPESHAVCCSLAARGCTTIAVDYRLAPALGLRGRRAPYPAAVDDCEKAWRQLEEYADGLAIPPDRRFIAGASAGGAMAASLALRLRDSGSVAPAGVILFYPLLHPILLPPSPQLSQSLTGMRRVVTFGPRSVSWMARTYVGKGNADRIPEAFPGGADLTDFPPTFIVNSEWDTLRPSGERFAEELAAVGRSVEISFEPGTYHGHLNTPRRPGFSRSIGSLLEWLNKDRAA